MAEANDSFTISSQETLLHHQHTPKKSRIKNPKFKILFTSILLILIAASIILSSIYKKYKKPNAYLSGSARFYCHLTPFPQLCHTSISSIIATAALKSDPGPLFAASLQVAINELNSTAASITEALSSPSPLLGSECQQLVRDSLGRLNESLRLLGDDSDVESLSYREMDEFRVGTKAAADSVGKCLTAVEIEGVEEVKLGVERANNLIANSIWLFDRRYLVYYDFYNPEGEDYSYGFRPAFMYWDLVYFYCVMYLFLALLYYLFWTSN